MQRHRDFLIDKVLRFLVVEGSTSDLLNKLWLGVNSSNLLTKYVVSVSETNSQNKLASTLTFANKLNKPWHSLHVDEFINDLLNDQNHPTVARIDLRQIRSPLLLGLTGKSKALERFMTAVVIIVIKYNKTKIHRNVYFILIQYQYHDRFQCGVIS